MLTEAIAEEGPPKSRQMTGNVLITDNLDPICVEILEKEGLTPIVRVGASADELTRLAEDADAWIVRSGTKITGGLIESAPRLQVIGRAGVGVDNIDVEMATRRGVLVINAPDGNTISTAEHTCAMIMAAVRRIPSAAASVRAGQWDRKAFTGSEVFEKTLGIIGVGKIGQAVALRMKPYGVRLLGYDPVLSNEVADRIGITLVSMDELLAQSDIITVHTPLTDSTRGLINAEALQRCRDDIYIINCARGGIVDEEALLEGLKSGKVAGAALDVFTSEPPDDRLRALLEHPRVVATPHIAASTGEAQTKVARQVTEQVVQALRGEPVNAAVNALAIRMAGRREVRPFVRLAEILGRMAAQLFDGHVDRVAIKVFGATAARHTEVLSVGALKGMFAVLVSGPVNLINAPVLAEETGLGVEEQTLSSGLGYTNLVEVQLESASMRRRVAGTIFGDDDPRVVAIDDYRFEIRPEGRMLVYNNVDRPGVLAAVGSVLAGADINIAAMALGRDRKGSRALTVIDVDEDIPPAVIARIAGVDGVEEPRLIRV